MERDCERPGSDVNRVCTADGMPIYWQRSSNLVANPDAKKYNYKSHDGHMTHQLMHQPAEE